MVPDPPHRESTVRRYLVVFPSRMRASQDGEILPASCRAARLGATIPLPKAESLARLGPTPDAREGAVR